MKKTIFFFLAFFFLSASPALAIDCFSSLSGDQTVSATCTLKTYEDGNNASRLISGVDSGTVSTNTATLTISAGTMTINSNETLVIGDMELTGGSVAMAEGAVIEVGKPMWMVDADTDGYPADTKIYAQTSAPTNGERLNTMIDIAIADCNDNNSDQNTACIYTRDITISYSGSTLTDHNVLVELDTATIISAGDLTSDCGDIRVYDSDDSTLLDYWIESGCNTADTQIWVKVPSIPDGGKTIYMHYDGTTTTDGTQAWAGDFTLLYNNTCPSGWTQNSTFDSRFPRGDSAYGTTDGASSHTHDPWTGSTGSGGNLNATVGSSGAVTLHDKGAHTHTVTVTHGTTTDVLPPYLGMVYCYKNQLDINSGLIGMFTSTPAGWTQFSALDDKFPYGATSYGATGGDTTHTHTATRTSYNAGNTASCTCCGSATRASTGHSSNASSTGTGSNIPAYLSVIFSSADSDTYGKAGMIAIVDALPPLGWTQFSALDDKFPYGATSYGATGGTDTHTHAVSYTEGAGGLANCAGGSLTRAKVHSHAVSYTTASASNIPPYTTAIFTQRNTPSATTSVGAQY
jgi:hypothetical protein